MSFRIKTKIKGDGLDRMEDALKALRGAAAAKAAAVALNEVGKVARNKVVAAVAKQAGVSRAVATKRGHIVTRPASAQKASFEIASEGGHLSLKDTKAVQKASGVRSDPWSRPYLFGKTFMGPRPGAVSLKLGGHVFKRDGAVRVMTKGASKGKKRQPIKRLYGAAIPKEIVKDASKAVFETYTAERLPKRIAHQLKRATKGVFD